MSIEEYSLTVEHNSNENKYRLSIKDSNNKEVFSKAISEEEYEKLREELENYSIVHDYTEKIQEILEVLKQQRVIEDYEIMYDTHENRISMHNTFSKVYIDVTMYINEELAKEIEKDEELSQYLDYNEATEQYTLSFSKAVVDAERSEVYTTAGKYESFTVYVSEKTASQLLQNFLEESVYDINEKIIKALEEEKITEDILRDIKKVMIITDTLKLSENAVENILKNQHFGIEIHLERKSSVEYLINEIIKKAESFKEIYNTEDLKIFTEYYDDNTLRTIVIYLKLELIGEIKQLFKEDLYLEIDIGFKKK